MKTSMNNSVNAKVECEGSTKTFWYILPKKKLELAELCCYSQAQMGMDGFFDRKSFRFEKYLIYEFFFLLRRKFLGYFSSNFSMKV